MAYVASSVKQGRSTATDRRVSSSSRSIRRSSTSRSSSSRTVTAPTFHRSGGASLLRSSKPAQSKEIKQEAERKQSVWKSISSGASRLYQADRNLRKWTDKTLFRGFLPGLYPRAQVKADSMKGMNLADQNLNDAREQRREIELSERENKYAYKLNAQRMKEEYQILKDMERQTWLERLGLFNSAEEERLRQLREQEQFYGKLPEQVEDTSQAREQAKTELLNAGLNPKVVDEYLDAQPAIKSSSIWDGLGDIAKWGGILLLGGVAVMIATSGKKK